MNSINKSSKIFIAGHLGMVGSACFEILKIVDLQILLQEEESHLIYQMIVRSIHI